MKKGRWLTAILGLVAAAAAAPAAAQDDRGLYVGGSFGVSHYYEGCKNLPIPCDDHDEAWRIFGGYRFNRYFSAEVGWYDLGAATSNGVFLGAPTSLEEHAEGFDVNVLAFVPVWNQLSIFGRLGIHHSRMTIDQESPGVSFHSGGSNTGYLVGAGLQYTLGPIGLRTEWVRYGDVGTTGQTLIQDDIDFYSVGLLWRF